MLDEMPERADRAQVIIPSIPKPSRLQPKSKQRWIIPLQKKKNNGTIPYSHPASSLNQTQTK
jgi:hypothetical protein